MAAAPVRSRHHRIRLRFSAGLRQRRARSPPRQPQRRAGEPAASRANRARDGTGSSPRSSGPTPARWTELDRLRPGRPGPDGSEGGSGRAGPGRVEWDGRGPRLIWVTGWEECGLGRAEDGSVPPSPPTPGPSAGTVPICPHSILHPCGPEGPFPHVPPLSLICTHAHAHIRIRRYGAPGRCPPASQSDPPPTSRIRNADFKAPPVRCPPAPQSDPLPKPRVVRIANRANREAPKRSDSGRIARRSIKSRIAFLLYSHPSSAVGTSNAIYGWNFAAEMGSNPALFILFFWTHEDSDGWK